jgi:hypothetical protein
MKFYNAIHYKKKTLNMNEMKKLAQEVEKHIHRLSGGHEFQVLSWSWMRNIVHHKRSHNFRLINKEWSSK